MPGLDRISNEMLKCATSTIIQPSHEGQQIPTSMITPIPKSGDLSQVENYRGSALKSYLSQLLNCVIFNKRIKNHMSENYLWSPNRCGFKSDHRTADNLFYFKCAIPKVHCEYETLVISDVRRKFFDCLTRTFLQYKLLSLNITGNIYHFRRCMYESCDFLCKNRNWNIQPFQLTHTCKTTVQLQPDIIKYISK